VALLETFFRSIMAMNGKKLQLLYREEFTLSKVCIGYNSGIGTNTLYEKMTDCGSISAVGIAYMQKSCKKTPEMNRKEKYWQFIQFSSQLIRTNLCFRISPRKTKCTAEHYISPIKEKQTMPVTGNRHNATVFI
jgi:hypothetical protein